MKLENNLGTDPIRPLVLRIAIPSMTEIMPFRA